MPENTLEEILRALGRVEGTLEVGIKHREDTNRAIEVVRSNVHNLRNDVQTHLNTTNDHERRISALELLPPLISQMAHYGERLREIEKKLEVHERLLAEARGVTQAVRWLWGAVLIAAALVSWSVPHLLKLFS